jgi:hypothetical protein
MPFVKRNAQGEIESVHRSNVAGAGELLRDDDPELSAFLGTGSRLESESFDRLDADFVRVIEDVIDTLIVKNVINITDLPAEAQAKLFARKSFRERVTRHSLRLFGDAGAPELVGDGRPSTGG